MRRQGQIVNFHTQNLGLITGEVMAIRKMNKKGGDFELEIESEDSDSRIENAEPGDDVPVAKHDSLTVINVIKQCMDEAKRSKSRRDLLDEQNWDAYHGRSMNNNKVDGQSDEFIPKVAQALEQIAASIKRGLVAFGNYFDVTLTPDPVITGSPLTASGIVKLIRRRIEDPDEIVAGCTDFPTTIEDGIKAAALSSLLILKIHGIWDITRTYEVSTENIHNTYKMPTSDTTGIDVVDSRPAYTKEDLLLVETRVWRLVVELVNPKDFFIDPTGRGLFHIHRTYKDLYQIVDAADTGDYDKEAVKELARASYSYSQDDQDLERQTNQPVSMRPEFRKEIEIWEFWGTLLDSDGGVAHRNCRCVIAGREYLILPPEPNPNAHGDHPFIYSPLVRVPFTTLHKGLFDQAVAFNLLLSDLFNLAADGALGSSWGVNLVQEGAVANIDQFEDCIPPGSTLIIKANYDLDKVFKNVKTGGVSGDTFNMMNYTDQQFNAATNISDTKLGVLPKKTQSATGIADASASTDNYIAAIIFNLEQNVIKPALRKIWLTMLQNMDDWSAEDVEGCIGKEAAKHLGEMSPARRFANYAMGSKFKVDGLSSLMARGTEFQKLMLLQQELTTNPMFAAIFLKKYSLEKFVQRFFKMANIDPEDFQLSEAEIADMPKFLERVSAMQQLLGKQGGNNPQSTVNQMQGNPQSSAEGAMNNQMSQTT